MSSALVARAGPGRSAWRDVDHPDPETVAKALGKARRTAKGWRCPCPAHDDDEPSLDLTSGDDGRLLWHCKAGCPQDAVLRALQERGLYPKPGDATAAPPPRRAPARAKPKPNGTAAPRRRAPRHDATGVWIYTTAEGEPLIEVSRYDPPGGRKFFRQRIVATGAWVEPGGAELPEPRPLYHLPDLAGRPGEPVVFVAGEKCAEALAELGFLATTALGGENGTALAKADLAPLTGRDVPLWRDNDAPGERWAAELARLLREAGARPLLVPIPPGKPAKWDAADAIESEGWIVDQIDDLIGAASDVPAEADVAAEPDVAALARLEQSDTGNADRLIARYGHDLLFATHAEWHTWDGRRWLKDDRQHAVVLAQKTARAIFAECVKIADSDAQKARAKWAVVSQDRSRINGMLAMAAPHLVVTADELDAAPYLLNVLNGTLDLEKGELRPHRRSDRLTALAPVAYDKNAKAPNWEAFLKAIFADDEELIGFLRRAVGYSLTGDTREQVLFLLHGIGSNGKSTLLKVLKALLGDYAQQTPTDTFMVKERGGNIPNDVARLKGARLAAAVETEDGRRLAEGLVKQATGGDPMAARFLHREWFEFTPAFKLWLATNHKPEIKGTDHAMWRRIRLIPFGVRFWKPDDEDFDQRPEGAPLVDTGLEGTLLTELPGILAWAVRGCQEWRKMGLGAPDTVKAATAEYRAEMDRLADFLADLCELAETYSGKAKDLHQAYEAWCQANGADALNQHRFGRALGERGFKKDKAGVIVYRGISLKEDWRQILIPAQPEKAS